MASRAALDLIINLKDNASKGMGGIAGQIAGFAAGGALLAGAKAGFDALSGAIGGSIAEAREGIAGMKQLQATLDATGGAVGLTATQIDDLSHSLSASTGLSKYSDDAVRSASTLLLRVNGLGKDTFPQAAQAAVDLAEKFGGPEQAAQFLAKALDKPATASKLLQNAGIALTAETENQIAAMAKAGDTAGAQALILAQVGTQTAGIAQAAATAQGPMLVLQARFADMQEAIGQKLLPIVDQFTGFLASPAVMGALQGVADLLVTGIGNGITFLVGVFQAVQPYFDQFVAFLMAASTGGGPNLTAFITGLPEPLRVAGQFIGDLVTNFSAFFTTLSGGGDIVGAFATLIGANFTAITTAVGGFLQWFGAEGLPLLVSKLGEWAAAFVAWIGPLIPPMLAELGRLAGELWTWLTGTALPTIVSKLGEWGAAFVAWIGPMIPPALAALGQFLADIGTWLVTVAIPGLVGWLADMGKALWEWIQRDGPTAFVQFALWFQGVRDWVLGTALPALVGMLKEWGNALVNWIGTDAIPFIGAALASFGQMIWDWLTGGGLTALISNLATWGAALVNWIATDAIPFIGGALGGFGDLIWTWITSDALPRFQAALQSVGGAFVNWVSQDAAPFIGGKLAAFGQQIWDWIAGAAQQARTNAIQMGTQMVEGVKQGLEGAWQGLMNKFGELAAQLPEPMRQALGIHSPSEEGRVMGFAMPEGIALGVTEGMPLVQAALDLTTQAILLWGTTLLGNVTLALDPLPTTTTTALANLQTAWSAFFAADAPLALTMFEGGDAFFPKLFERVNARLETWFSTLWKPRLDTLEQEVANFFVTMRGTVSAAAQDVGLGIGQGLAAGIQGEIQAVASAAADLVTSAINAARQAADVHSPSKETIWIAQMMGQGLIAGLDKSAPQLAGAAGDLTAVFLATGADLIAGAAQVGNLMGVSLVDAFAAQLQSLPALIRAATLGASGGPASAGGSLRAAGAAALPSAGGFGAGAGGNPFAGITTVVFNVRGGGGMRFDVDSIETEAGYRQRATRRGGP